MPRKDKREKHFVFQKGDGKLLEQSIEAVSGWLADNKLAYRDLEISGRGRAS